MHVFVARSAMLVRDIGIGGVSDRLTVCPSHAGIDSKLTTVRSRSFHHPVAQGLYF